MECSAKALAILFIAALFALDTFLLEAQAEEIAVVLVFEGARRGLQGLGRDEFIIWEVGKVRSDRKGVLFGKKKKKAKRKLVK